MGYRAPFQSGAPGRSRCVPHGLTTPGDFRPLHTFDAKAQSATDPTAGPAFKGISSTSLPFQRARAQDRLLPCAPARSCRAGLARDCQSDLVIRPGSSLPVHSTTPASPPFRRPERPRTGQAKTKLGRFLRSERGRKDFPALSTLGPLNPLEIFAANPSAMRRPGIIADGGVMHFRFKTQLSCPRKRASNFSTKPESWIPAFAGMTMGLSSSKTGARRGCWCSRHRWCRHRRRRRLPRCRPPARGCCRKSCRR